MKNNPPLKTSFLSGVFCLSLSALLVKLTGMLTKIPLMHLLGASGMGYYNTAYEVYAALFVLSSAGLPVALSLLISKDPPRAREILRTAQRVFAAIGLSGAALLWCFPAAAAAAIGNENAAPAIRALAPAVLFICLSCALRGYYQGLRDMRPTAVSQWLEALGKLLLGLLFATLAHRAGKPLTHVAAAAAWGLTGGTGLSWLYLRLRFGIDQKREGRRADAAQAAPSRPAQRILRRLVAVALPITLGSGVNTLIRLLDMVLILRCLGRLGEEAANALYGTYSTLALPLYTLLPALVGSVALPLVPGIAHAREMGDGEEERGIVMSALRLTLWLALPAAFGLAAFSRPILSLLFGGEGNAAAVAAAAPMLTLLSASIPAACLMSILHAMLQAYGRPRAPLYTLLLGAAVKLIVSSLLLSHPRVGILGAPLGTLVCNLAVVLADLRILRPLLPRLPGLGRFCRRTVFCAAFSVGVALALWRWAGSRWVLSRPAVLAAVLLCVLLYPTLTLALGALPFSLGRRPSHTGGGRKPILIPNEASGGENVVVFHENHDKLRKTS